MRFLAGALVASVVAALVGCCQQAAPTSFTPLPLSRDVVWRAASVTVFDPNRHPLSQGTGILLDPSLLFTAHHVVKDAPRIEIRLISRFHTRVSEASLDGQVAFSDPQLDLALLRFVPPRDSLINDLQWPPVPRTRFLSRPLSPGELVFVQDRHTAWPGSAGLPNPLRTGAALSPTQIDVSGEPGSSGSGVFVIDRDAAGEFYALAGLIVSRSPLPPAFHEEKAIPLQDGQTHRLRIFLAGRWVTNIVPACALRDFLKRYEESR